MARNDSLIWIDLEMTGLDPDNDRILEVATLVTDSQLGILAEGPVIAIHQDEVTLARMDEWNQRTHKGTGLLARVRSSGITAAAAEQQTLEFLRQHAAAGASPMCGNSICQDRRFLARYMPELERHFHYRNLDVSTIKELARRWAPGVGSSFVKQGTHRALDDIRESVAELRHYRQHFFASEYRGT
jgi:oligoribonuclease